jgi:SAM-dependent methyltransferase
LKALSLFMPDTLIADADPLERFFGLLEHSLAEGRFVKLVLAKSRAPEADLVRLSVREIALKDQACLSFVSSHSTRDVTQNFALAEGLALLREQVATAFSHAHLLTATEDIQLLTSKKGKRSLSRAKAAHGEAQGASHDREKQRLIAQDRPFLMALGVTDAQHRLVPAMSRKWKQINKFVEVFSHALAASPLAQAQQVRVVDFGSGKGYLTFAVHDHLSGTLGRQAQVTGVELRPDMVRLCNAAAARLGLDDGLAFEQGDVRSYLPQALDVMIALHACDTATDHAIHLGLRAGAAIIMCSPCCHKQLRPQLLSPHPLRPILQHGVHLGQEAEMLTDGLRALLLEACGYETQVFEFVSLEHTQKNKMILAVKRAQAQPPDTVLAQIRDIKGFYGIREQCLETLLQADGMLP